MATHPHAVLLLGVPRGGTTWVGTVLGTTAGARYVHEPDGTHEPFAFAAKLDLLHHPMLEPDDRCEPYERLWRGAFAGGVPSGSIADHIARRVFKRMTGDDKMRARQDGVRTVRTRIALATAQPLRGDDAAIRHAVVKTVNGAFAAEWIARRGADHVGVISRHPLNVVASWRDFGWNPPQGVMYAAIRDRARQAWQIDLPTADASALQRAAAMATALAFELETVRRQNPEWIAISHEDLCSDPGDRFPKIASALGLEWNDTATTKLAESNRPGSGYATNRVAANEVDRWRERLAPAEIDEIVDVAARFPADLGWLERLA